MLGDGGDILIEQDGEGAEPDGAQEPAAVAEGGGEAAGVDQELAGAAEGGGEAAGVDQELAGAAEGGEAAGVDQELAGAPEGGEAAGVDQELAGAPEGGEAAGVDELQVQGAGGAAAAGAVQQPQAAVQLKQLSAEEEAELTAMLLPLLREFRDGQLQKLTVERILSEPDLLTESLLSQLTGPCLQQVMLATQGNEQLKFLGFSKFLVCERAISRVVVPLAPSSMPQEEARDTYDSICSTIADTCADSLKSLMFYGRIIKFDDGAHQLHLGIRQLKADHARDEQTDAAAQTSGPSQERMHEMLRSLPLLQSLALDTWPTTNETLQVIADTCTDLRELELDSPHVTLEGLCYLCDRCSELRELYLGSSPGISTADLLHVLARAPNLYCLVHLKMHNAVHRAVRKAEDEGSTPHTFSLGVLACMFGQGDLPFERINGSFPHLQHLRVSMVSDLDQFSSLNQKKENLKSITLKFTRTASALISSQLPNFFSVLHNAQNLTALSLFLREGNLVEVDLSQIGEAFPNLRTLVIHSRFQFRSVLPYKVNKSHFSKLEYLLLYTKEHVSQLSSEMLVQLLSSPELVFASVLYFNTTPEVFAAVADGRTHPVFPRLQSLFLSSEGWSTRQVIELLVSRAPRLQGLLTVGLSSTTAAQCQNIITKYAPWINNFDNVGH